VIDIEELSKRHLIPISLIIVSMLTFFYLISFNKIFILFIALYAFSVSIILTFIFTGKMFINYLKVRRFFKRLKKEIEKFKE